MPDQVDAELQRLRARAYGPGADIDEASAERLRELEARHLTARAARTRDAAVPRSSEEPPADPLVDLFGTVDASPAERAPEGEIPPRPAPPVLRERVRNRSESPHPEPAPEGAAEAEPPLAAPVSLGPDPLPRTLDRRLRTAWIASLAVAVAVTALITAWVLPSHGGGTAARLTAQPGELSEEARQRLPIDSESELRYFGSYLELDVYRTDDCVIVFADGSQNGAIGFGCGGTGIEPVADVYVRSAGGPAFGSTVEFPEAVVNHLPDGGIIRFAGAGDVILVDEGALPQGW